MEGFLMYRDYAELFAFLSREDKADLMESVFAYAFEGREPEGLSTSAMIVFTVMKRQYDRDREKYEQKCEKNRKNAAFGGRPPKTGAEKGEGSRSESGADKAQSGTEAEGVVEPQVKRSGAPEKGSSRDANAKKYSSNVKADRGSFDTEDFFFAALNASMNGGG